MTTQLRLPWCCSEARRLGITLNAIPFAHSKDSTWRLSNGALCSGWKFIVTWLPALLHPCHFPALSGFPGTGPAATSYPTNRLWSRVSIWDTAAHWCKSYEDQWIGTIMRWRMIGSISCIFIIPNSIPNRSHLIRSHKARNESRWQWSLVHQIHRHAKNILNRWEYTLIYCILGCVSHVSLQFHVSWFSCWFTPSNRPNHPNITPNLPSQARPVTPHPPGWLTLDSSGLLDVSNILTPQKSTDTAKTTNKTS